MSRTFRKNRRYFYHANGEFYSSYKNPSMKAHIPLKDYDSLPSFDHPWKIYSYCQIKRFVVRVCDGDNYGCGIGGSNKSSIHRTDRARYKNRLNTCSKNDNYDNVLHINTSFDPWDWD